MNRSSHCSYGNAAVDNIFEPPFTNDPSDSMYLIKFNEDTHLQLVSSDAVI